MKTLNSIVLNSLFMILAVITICNIPGNLSAQTNCFYDSGIQEYTSTCTNVSSISNVTHTGNDSRGTMEVNVWDGDYPGLSWYENSNPYQGCIALPQGIIDPDVVYSGGYAVVVYADQYNKCIFDVYTWTGTAFSPTGSQTTLQACSHDATYSTTINIDLDELGNFTIVWDDLTESRIIAQGGYISGGTPTLTGKAIVVNGSDYQMPDVSMTKRNCVSGCRSEVYCTYVDTRNNNNVLHIDGGYYEDWIVSNTCTTTNVNYVYFAFPAYHSGAYLYPRIACHTFVDTTSYHDWTVVVEGGSNEIIGFTFDFGSNTTTPYSYNIYTDGLSNSPCAIDNERNQFPVVTYDDGNKGMMVGWQSEYSGDNAFVPTGVVTLMCYMNGRWDNSVCGNYYLIIPYDNYSYSPASEQYLSLSGRDYTSIQYTFYDDFYPSSAPDILYKNVVFGSTCNLRPLRKTNNIDNTPILFPNPFNDIFEISLAEKKDEIFSVRIFNLIGEELFNFKGDEDEINKSFHILAIQLIQGVYFLQLKSVESKELLLKKFVKM